MASNPFKQNKEFSNQPNRNSFDLSHSNNLTCNFGQLIPVACIPTVPGDSFCINTAFALRFMPTVFPVQTKCRAFIHFFYQRNKNLWPNFKDFIAGNKEYSTPSSSTHSLVPPYVVQSGVDNCFGTGMLSDYLNIPTTFQGAYGSSVTFSADYYTSSKVATIHPFVQLNGNSRKDFIPSSYTFEKLRSVLTAPENTVPLGSWDSSFPYSNGTFYSIKFKLPTPPTAASNNFTLKFDLTGTGIINHSSVYCIYFNSSNTRADAVVKCSMVDYYASASFDFPPEVGRYVALLFVSNCGNYITEYITSGAYTRATISASVIDYSDVLGTDTYTIANGLPLNALPFRCYESIYNAFYRDARNNPLLDSNDQPVYNKFLLDDGDGLDKNNYTIRHRNWELDQFTSCVHSPQQGVAPLVGISSTGKATFLSEDGAVTLQAKTADDNDTIVGFEMNDNVPNSVARAVVETSTQGISINDFRAVNSFQRWLETNIRRGFKYKDQIKARWGVDLEEKILDMPEFLGGVSCDVDINTVSQTSETESSPLGSYAGQMSAFGRSEHSINHFCDDYGYIMAILSVVPTPSYSCTLPKHFTDFSPLDYYSPEFAHIGMQPITYKELIPLATLRSDGKKALSNVFGYQRPWWQYLNMNDEVHGLFRTSLHNFVLNREFDAVPELNGVFTTIDHNSLNNVFSTEVGDKILGQIYFDIEAKRPIPAISIPSIQ